MSTDTSTAGGDATKNPLPDAIAKVIGVLVFHVVGAVAIAGTLHGELTVDGVGTVLAVLVLPVVSLVLSFVGALPQYPWWVWWLVLPFWLMFFVPVPALDALRTGEWDAEDRWDSVKAIFYLGARIVVLVALGGVSQVLGFSTRQGAELVAVSMIPVYPLPVALFTPRMEFPATVWVLVVVVWYVLHRMGKD